MMSLTGIQYVLGVASGALVGFTLGLVGGGGSILAVPLMVYLVGVQDPHVAIGTSALAVAANALLGLLSHARHRTVRWQCGLMFASTGVIGAWAGSTAGKHYNGQRLLFLFALVMVVSVLGAFLAGCKKEDDAAGGSAAGGSAATSAGDSAAK